MFRKLGMNYIKLPEPVKASLWFLICGFLQKGISMLTTPVFTRIMTDAEYGRFSVYNSWLSIVQIIVSLNLAAGVYTRGLVKNEEDQDRFSSSMLGLSTTSILIWSVIYFLFHEAINQWLGLSTLLMTAMLVEVWAHEAYQFWSNRERVHYRYKKLVVLTLAYVILRPLLGVLCVLQVDEQHQVEARVLTTVLVNLALFSVLYIVITKKGKQFFSKKYWLYALKFNIPLIPHYLSQMVLSQSDRLMINRFCGPTETAYYTVAYTLAMVLLILNNSISATMNPWIYKSIKNDQAHKIGKVSYSILGIIALMNLAVILVAPEIMGLLAPPNYMAAIWVVPPVTASVYFTFLYNLFATFEYYFEKTHYVTVATVAGAALNILLNAVFIPKFGFVAAGYTTLFCYILYALAHYCFMRKVVKAHMEGTKIYDIKIIIVLGAALLAGAALIMLFYTRPVIRYSLLIVLIVGCVWKRRTLLNVIHTIKNKHD